MLADGRFVFFNVRLQLGIGLLKPVPLHGEVVELLHRLSRCTLARSRSAWGASFSRSVCNLAFSAWSLLMRLGGGEWQIGCWPAKPELSRPESCLSW